MVLLYKTELVPQTANAIALVKVFLAIGQHFGSSVATRLRSRRVVLNKHPSKTLNYTQGAEDARRELALQPSDPRLHSRTQAQPALAEHSSLHKSLPPLSSQAGHLSLPPVGVEQPWAGCPHKGKGSFERSIARAIGSSYLCCRFSSFLFDRRTVFAACQAHCTKILSSGFLKTKSPIRS